MFCAAISLRSFAMRGAARDGSADAVNDWNMGLV
jgi:hypothetical protein